MKKKFSGIYTDVRKITPEHLLEFYLKGYHPERSEAGDEILRRLRMIDLFRETLRDMGKKDERDSCHEE